MISDKQIEQFLLNPNFNVICPDILVGTLDKDIKNIDFPSPKFKQYYNYCQSYCDLFISRRALTRNNEAKIMYKILSDIKQEIFDKYPIFYLLLSEVHFWLEDQHGSYDILKKLKNIIGPENSQELDLLMEIMKDSIEYLEQDYEYLHEGLDENGELMYKNIDKFKRSNYIKKFDVKYSIEEILKYWNENKSKNNEKDLLLQFSRYACLSTNELEGVFETDGRTWTRLVKRGFYKNSIEGISMNSRINKKNVIVRILENTNSALELISRFLDTECCEEFNNDFIKSIHKKLLYSDNIEEHEDYDGNIVYTLVPSGEYRRVPCYTKYSTEDNFEDDDMKRTMVQYCHHNDIEKEMELYCERARKILKDDTINPFLKASWLQWAFIRIHPFADGNGRVSRIISSIPLYYYNLPPVVVTLTKKEKYFQVLRTVDESEDLSNLANFIVESMIDTILYLTELNNNDNFDKKTLDI